MRIYGLAGKVGGDVDFQLERKKTRVPGWLGNIGNFIYIHWLVRV